MHQDTSNFIKINYKYSIGLINSIVKYLVRKNNVMDKPKSIISFTILSP